MDKEVEEAIALSVEFVVGEVEQEIRRHIQSRTGSRTRPWVRSWIARTEDQGAASTLLREWAEEDATEYRNHLRIAPAQFEFLLNEVAPRIQKSDTWLRRAVPARTKFTMTLRYLATGDNWSTLSALQRFPKSTMSKFFPEVCDAVYTSLEKYIEVRKNSRALRGGSPDVQGSGTRKWNKTADAARATASG